MTPYKTSCSPATIISFSWEVSQGVQLIPYFRKGPVLGGGAWRT